MNQLNEEKNFEKLDSAELMELVFRIQNEERTRIARDLHDSIGCLLSTTSLLFETIEPINTERFEEVKFLLKETQLELRRVVKNLMPSTLEKLGLKAAIEQLCFQINKKREIDAWCEIEGFNEGNFTAGFKINVYRIVQELLNNSIKYSKASKMELLLKQDNVNLYMIFKDNGVGISTKNKNILSINARIFGLKGKLVVKSPALGSEIQVILPSVKM